MSKRDFIRKNRARIDEVINAKGATIEINDKEREMWVLNDEGLYNWARSEGVRV